MRVETLTPVVQAAPGARARWRLRIENDSPATVGYRLRVIGFDPSHVIQPPPQAPLEPGSSDELDLDLVIPEAFAAGDHSIAIEVTPDRPGVAPVIAAVTVTVGTIDEVALAVVPSTIRARRRARFHLDIDNRSTDAMELELEGDSAELEIEMRPDRVPLQPGERVRTSGRIKGPRHLFGEPRQHSLTVAARSRSAPAYAPATYQQRPLFPRGLRTLLAALLIIGIWGGALGAGYLWWTSRDDKQEEAVAELVDTDGDGVPDTPGDQLIDTDGDGVPDTVASVVAEQVAAAGGQGPPQAGGSDVPTRTSMGGTVAAGDGGQATGVDVTLTPIDVGAPPPEGATQLGFRNGELRELDGGTGTGKFWPARFGRYESDVRGGFRQTESVPDVTSTDERGVWFFGSVSVGQSYEVSFSRPGYDTQSFVVTPSADGKPIDLPVEMQPASGSVSGTVTGPGGPLGNVDLVLTDGTLVFNSASASEGERGTFSFTGVSTPGTYTLRADAAGLGTEVLQVTLEAGEERGGVNIRMSAGVGSISGRVTEDGDPLGGVTLTASNGDTTVETTSLTEGDTGSYLFPRLEIPGRWTIEARRDGYVTQTRLVTLNGNARGIDFAMIKRTGAITGLVESSNGGPLPGVNIRVSRDDLHFDTQTAVSPDPGSFNVRDLPPGSYLVELTRYDHEPTSQTVTIAPGQVVDLGTLTMVFRPRPDIPQNGGLDVQVVNSEGSPLGGATVRVLRNADNSLVAEQAGAPDQTSFFFQPLPIGTYRVEVTKGVTYRLSSRVVSVGLVNTTVVIPIYLLGQVHGRLIDSSNGAELIDYDVQIRRINPDGTESIVQNLPVTAATPPKAMPPDGHLERRFETANPPGLTSGTYRVVIDNPPPGYRVLTDQVLQPGMPPMQFRIEPDNDTPLDLGNILADRFPEIHGVVLSPLLDTAPAGTPRPISFAPIDDNSLQVTLLCPGANPDDEESELELPNPDPDPTHAFHGSQLTDAVVGSGAGLDTYYIDPVDLEEHDLFGACRMEVSVAGYSTKTFDLRVEAVRGQHAVLHRNVGLVRPRDIAGTAYWLDDGPTTGDPRVPAVGVRVRLQGDAVTGLVPGSAPYDSDGSEPTPERETVAEVFTDPGGGWIFPGFAPPGGDPASTVPVPRQVFGEAVYVFELPGQFQPRTVGLTIDEAGKRAVGILPNPPPFPLDVSLTGDQVQLDADGAPITARLQIRTVKGSPGQPALSLAGFSAQLTGANTATATPVLTGGNSLTQVLQATTVAFPATPDPGTHQWTVTPPATPADGRPRFKEATAADLAPSATFFQPPGTPLSAATVPQLTKTFVEMGAANIQVVDRSGAAVTGAQARIVGPLMTVPVTVAGADNVVAGLDVPTTPNGSTNYRVELPAALNTRLDVERATVQVFDHRNVLVANCTLGVGDCGTVNVVQGGQPRVRIVVQRYGSLTATVCGTTSDTTFTCDETLRIDGVPPLRVTATLVAVRSTSDPSTCVAPTGPTVRATVEVSPTGSFTFFGPPGYYEVVVEHDDYASIAGEFAAQVPQFDHECVVPVPTIPPSTSPQFLNQPVYQLQNDQPRPALTDPWYLLRLRSEVTITVFNDILLPTPGPVLAGAAVTITPDGQPSPAPLLTDANGQVTRTGANALLPGVYTIKVENAGYFPLTVRINIRRGGGGVGVRIPLPRVGGSITGTVVARNTEGDALLPPVGVVVSDNYDQPDAAVTGATVLPPPPPPTPDPTQPGSRTAAPTTNVLVAEYSFTGLGSGTHHLSYAYDNAAGTYRNVPPADVPVTVLSPGASPAPPAIYTAENRDLVVTLHALDDPSDAQVRLIDPDSAGAPGPPATLTDCTPADAPETCTARFDDLPPERTDYRVLVTKELYAPLTTAVNVAPGNPAVPVTLDITLTGTTARVTGEVDRVEDEGQPQTINDAPDGTSVRLLQMPAGTVSQTTTTSGGRGGFTFDIPAEGNYAVEAVLAGYATRRSATFEVGVGGLVRLGRRARLRDPVIVEKLATVSINVSGPPATSVTGVARPSGTGAPGPIPMARSGSTFTASLDPQWSYRFEFTSNAGYSPAAVPATPVDPAIGEDLDNTRVPDVTMTARTIAGTVTVAPGATLATSGTVRATNAAGAVVGSVGDISPTGTFTLNGPFVAGTYTLVAESFGVGRGEVDVPIADADPDRTGVALALTARTVATTFSSSPANASVRVTPAGGGTAITGTAGATPIPISERAFPATYVVSATGFISSAPGTLALSSVNEATSDTRWDTTALTMTVPQVTLAARTITGTVDGTAAGTVRARSAAGVVGNVDDAAGTFTLTGPFGPGTYTVVAEELGRGRAVSAPIDVADDAAPSPPSQTLTLSPRTVNTTFTSAPAGAAIRITTSAATGSTVITGTAGTAIAVPENAFPISYVASLAGYQDTAATIVNLGPAEAAAPGRWDLEVLTQSVTTPTLLPRTIGGTVTGATAATVRVPSGPTTTVGPVAPANPGFTLPGPFLAGTSYSLVAEQLKVGRGTTTVTTGASSTGSVTGVTIGLTARPVNLTVTITGPASAAIAVTSPAGSWSGTSGTAFQVPESAFPVTITATASGFQTLTLTGVDLTPTEDPATRWNAEVLTMGASGSMTP